MEVVGTMLVVTEDMEDMEVITMTSLVAVDAAAVIMRNVPHQCQKSR